MDYHYKLKEASQLHIFSDENVRLIDWNKDFNLINQYYKNAFGIFDLLQNDPEDFEIINTIAYMQNGTIQSLALIYKIRDFELEIGAVSTDPDQRCKGYCTACVSFAAKIILDKGCTASITTSVDNIGMQAVAEKIGFTRIIL